MNAYARLEHRSARIRIQALLASATVLVCTQMAHASPPDTIQITGTVRDFLKSHPDFNVTPAGGNGHIAALVPHSMAGNAPTFSGGGFKVNSQWRDQGGNNIPQHLYSNGGAIQLVNAMTYNPAKAYVDSWDSSAGPYGGGNVGPMPSIQTGVTMAPIAPPTGLGPNTGPRFFGTPNSTHTISSDIHCTTLGSDQRVTINISGHRTIYCTSSFILAKENKVFILPNSSLKLYVNGLFKISQSTIFNMVNASTTGNPANVQIYNMSSLNPGIHLNQSSKLCAQIYSPNASMQMDQNDHFYGSFMGLTVNMDQGCGFHFDGMPQSVCGIVLADTAGAAGVGTAGGISSASSFSQWFQDYLGANLSTSHTITLTRNASGIYEYISNSFLPIDGRLFGNEGDAHNYCFTFAFSADFVYNACQSPQRQFIEFMGADDAFSVIDGKLGLDVGGIMPLTSQRVEIDRLGLVDGQTYTLHFYFAQRNTTMSVFHLKTNIELLGDSMGTISVSAAYD